MRSSSRTRLRWRSSTVSLLWRVFVVNIIILVAALALLTWAPVTVHRVATPSEFAVLSIGLVVMLAVDLALLRRVLAPLRRLAAVMGSVEPGEPGRRAKASPTAGREVVALAEALNSMLDRLEDERRESGRRALTAQETERLRIARELHDEVGQTLTAVALRAEQAAGEPARQQQALTEIADTVQRSLDDVRRIGRELRPEALDDLGLVSALSALCSRIERQSRMRVRRELDGRLPALPDEVELVIYRVAQESLTNALRHAEAVETKVSLQPADGCVILTVSDDGCGLPPRHREGGIGGMRERAMLIGAELRIRRPRAGGTAITLTIPLDGEEEE